MIVEKKNTPVEEDNDFLFIKDLFSICLSKWYWFLISGIVALLIAVLYLLITPPTFERSMSVMVKEDSKSSSIGDVASMFSEMGVATAGVNVNNELIAIQSPSVLLETIKRLDLNVNYFLKGGFYKKTLYGTSLPIKVSFLELSDTESASFSLVLNDNSTVSLNEFSCAERELDELDQEVCGALNDTLITPIGKLVVSPSLYYADFMNNEEQDSHEFFISRSNYYDAVTACQKRLAVSLADKKATIINLSYTDLSTERAVDILNTIVQVYKEQWMRDKNEITASTTDFINERLKVIELELGDVDDDISSYKSKHLLPDVSEVSKIYLEQSKESSKQLLELNTQLSMAKYVKDYLLANSTNNQLLPANTGIKGGGVEAQIDEYNTIQLKRNNLVANSSEQNPLVVDLDLTLKAMREAILTSVDNLIVTFNTQIADLQKNEQKIVSQIASNPDQAKYLLSVGRQQKVKEALYLFLLQKREENQLSQTFTAYNTRILTPPTGALKPVAPQKMKILLVALVVGLLLPLGVIFVMENFNTKLRGKMDLERISIPFLGEIPLHVHSNKMKLNATNSDLDIVVSEGKRNVINEAFRVLRTNFEFVAKPEENIFMVTSFNPGSGKSFLSVNLAISMAIKGNSVLLIDGDMRHASSSLYVGAPAVGLSDYLNGRVNDVDKLLIKDTLQKGLTILPVGSIPPNPAELLDSTRLKELLDKYQSMYDYILVDAPPIDVVADAQIISRNVTSTLFVVRVGLLERELLTDLEMVYQQKRLPNMSLVLNGVKSQGGRYGYGYYYGSGNYYTS